MRPFQFTAIPGKAVYLSRQSTTRGLIESHVIGIVTKDFADEIEKLHQTCKLMQKFMASLPEAEDIMQKQNRQAMQEAIGKTLSQF